MKEWRMLVVLILSICIFFGLIRIGFSAEKVEIGEYYNLSDYEKLTGKKITKFNEAPQLAELVKQGKLPSVEQRS